MRDEAAAFDALTGPDHARRVARTPASAPHDDKNTHLPKATISRNDSLCHLQRFPGPESHACVSHVLAKAPTTEVRWVQRMASEGGGATLDVVLALTARACDGRELWRAVAEGFGTADTVESNFLWTNPEARLFQPAADAALADLARNLDAALAKADLRALRADEGEE